MPHIELHGYHSEMNVERIDISVTVDFSNLYYSTPKANEKLKELQADLEKVMEKYFEPPHPIISSRWLYNHDFNRNREPDC